MSAIFRSNIDMGAADRHAAQHRLAAGANQRRDSAVVANAFATMHDEDAALSHIDEVHGIAESIGYQHGFRGKPLNYRVFAQLLADFYPPADFPDLRSSDYESSYVAGHMNGDKACRDRTVYARAHGESRGPMPPILDIPMSI